MKTKGICLLTLIFSFSLYQARAQNDALMSSPSGVITIHTSSQFYKAGESLLFRAYIQKEGPDKETPNDNLLYAALLDQEGNEVANGAFPVKKGSADGELILSDQLAAGHYILIACPAQFKKTSPGQLFSKIIRIERPEKNGFEPYIQLNDSLYKPGSALKATLSFFGKEDELVQASFEYKLMNGSVEILTGKDKPEKNKPSVIALTLPSFKTEDGIILYLSASYKGIKRNAGIVIPVSQNMTGVKPDRYVKQNSEVNKPLKITIKPGKLSYGPTDKIEAEIIVTDSKGANVSTDLSISACNADLIPQPLRNDNRIISVSGYNSLWYKAISGTNDSIPMVFSAEKEKKDQHGFIFSEGLKKMFAGYFSSVMKSPGQSFIVQEKNEIKKINDRKAPVTTGKQQDYSSERSIYDILMKVKPYTLVDNKIIFPSSGITSLNNQDGALIVIDGIKFGTAANALSNVAVSDILKITASTNSMDVQKYSALNSVGLVEVYTKTGATTNTNEVTVVEDIKNPLFWQKDLKTNFFGKATVSFNNNSQAPVIITVAGINEKGETGSNSIVLNMK